MGFFVVALEFWLEACGDDEEEDAERAEPGRKPEAAAGSCCLDTLVDTARGMMIYDAS